MRWKEMQASEKQLWSTFPGQAVNGPDVSGQDLEEVSSAMTPLMCSGCSDPAGTYHRLGVW